ncbi:hypothetical protein EYS14_00125 [Alteromonadaceae bacterium M269]|nr:hypothetical protein EYS14_00125 [Alteromonadaceae bacterium M269]
MDAKTTTPEPMISELPSYTVDSLMTRLSIDAQNQIWRKVDALIRVQGQVSNIKDKPYNGFSYFTLTGANATFALLYLLF